MTQQAEIKSNIAAPSLQQHRAVPIAYEADVVVIGGGPGGFAAALQAARMGARTIMIERFDMPGGVHTSGLQGSADAGVGGIHTELMERFAAEGYIYTATESTHPGWAGNPLSHYERNKPAGAEFKRMSFNPEGAGCVMADMLEEVASRYGKPLFIAETGAEGSGRPAWLHYVCDEVRQAQGRGADIQGICIYPITAYPGWDNSRHCQVGLFSPVGSDGRRHVFDPLYEELQRQREIFGVDQINPLDTRQRRRAGAGL